MENPKGKEKTAIVRSLTAILGLAIACFLGVRAGLMLKLEDGYATHVWPAAGVALAGLLLYGRGNWPGVFLGIMAGVLGEAQLGSLATLQRWGISAGLAAGTTLEAVLATWLMRHWLKDHKPFERPEDVFRFGLTVCGACLVSALIGPALRCAWGVAPWGAWPETMLVWWLGDIIGILALTPLAMLWRERGRRLWSPGEGAEAALLVLVMVAGSGLVFNVTGPVVDWAHWKYLCVGPLLWVAFRFGRREAAAAYFFVVVLAFWGTVPERGGIDEAFSVKALVSLQIFLGFAGVTTLVVAAAVAQRKTAEDSVRLVVESAPNGMVMVDQTGRITLVNAQMEQLFGYRREEMLGQVIEMLLPERYRAAHPGMRDRFLAAPQARPMGRGRDLFARRKDGTEFPVEIGLNPAETPDGRFVLASVIDITERKRAEQELKHAREVLEATVAERTAALRASLSSMEELLYTIAHDLRAPNRAMSGFAQLLLEEHGQQLDEQARHYLDRIAAAAARNDQLIRDLLAYGRISHEAITLAPVDPGQVVEAVLRDLKDEIERRNARIQLGATWPAVRASEPMLHQVITHLLTNALLFVAPGTAPAISISAERSRDAVVLRVKDNGIGIPPDQLRKIFIPFMRLPNGLDAPGTGMGLAIVKKAAERMLGRTGAESAPGAGSCFWVELPAA